MARIRAIKPDFFKDEDLKNLPHQTRLFYIGLWCQADKEGRLEERPERLKIEIFPYEEAAIEKMLVQLAVVKKNSNGAKLPYIVRYVVNEKKFVQILKWHHQRPHHTEPPSTCPPPPETVIKPFVHGLEPLGNGKGNGNEKKAGQAGPVRKESDEEWLQGLKSDPAYRHIQVQAEFAKARRWCQENPSRQLTRRFFVNWLNRIQQPIRAGAGPSSAAKRRCMPCGQDIDIDKFAKHFEKCKDEFDKKNQHAAVSANPDVRGLVNGLSTKLSGKK